MPVQKTLGTSADDVLTGTSVRDVVLALAGDDLVLGLGGNDNLYGGDGNDRLYGGEGADQLYGGSGDDLLDGGGDSAIDSALYSEADAAVAVDLSIIGPQDTIGGGLDTLIGIERVVGSEHADILRGGLGDDRLIGGGGDDVLFGGGGHDILDGRDGDDAISGGDLGSRLIGGLGDDLIRGRLGDDIISGGDGGMGEGHQNSGDDLVFGGGGNDVLRGGGGRDHLHGEDGDDILYGYAGANGGDDRPVGDSGPGDVLDGGAGDDVVYGSLYNDTILALAGHDRIFGNSGNDQVYVKAAYADGGVVEGSGGLDYDTLHILAGDPGGVALDLSSFTKFEAFALDPGLAITLSDSNGEAVRGPITITGGTFVDASAESDASIIYFGDTTEGGPGARVIGGQKADDLTGGAGDDHLSGGAGADRLTGGGGQDRLDGGNGDDSLTGGAGLDVLIGGAAADTLSGGADDDRFLYLRLADSRSGVSQDHILDFSAGDRVDLSLLDANSRISGDQAFTFVGDQAFHGVGEVRFEVMPGGCLVQADVDGDGHADLQILVTRLDGVLGFSAGDFLL